MPSPLPTFSPLLVFQHNRVLLPTSFGVERSAELYVCAFQQLSWERILNANTKGTIQGSCRDIILKKRNFRKDHKTKLFEFFICKMSSEKSSLLSEKKGFDEEQPEAGLGDGFSGWSDSNQAFQQGIFHCLFFIGTGIVFYSFILDTKFTVIESIYFSVTIFTTVGYGDMSPASSTAGMLFTMFFALYGIIILGIFLGILADMAVARQEKLNEEAAKRASGSYLDTMLSKLPDVIDDEAADDPNASFLYDIYEVGKDLRTNLVILIILATPIITLEKWSIMEGLYWLLITCTTVGFGDESPEHPLSMFLCIFFIPLAVAFGGTFLGNVATLYVDKRNDAMEAQFLNRALSESALDKMDANNDNTVTKDEFLVYMLKTLGKAEQDDIDKILQLFDKLDKDKSGSLTSEDLQFIPNQTARIHDRRVRPR